MNCCGPFEPTKVANFSHILLKKIKAMSPKHLCAGCLSALKSPLALACAFSIAPFVHDLLSLLTAGQHAVQLRNVEMKYFLGRQQAHNLPYPAQTYRGSGKNNLIVPSISDIRNENTLNSEFPFFRACLAVRLLEREQLSRSILCERMLQSSGSSLVESSASRIDEVLHD
jgi:hypothetical protein